MKTLEFIQNYGPTPLAEMTARLSETPDEVAESLNQLADKDLLQVTDEKGRKIAAKITPDQAATRESWVAELTSRGIKRSFGL